jgi:probable phosphoglycerate mutase
MADSLPATAQRPPGAPDPHEAHLTRVVAVRHGETVWNAEMRMQGQLDTALSARGRWQAGRAAGSLAGEGIEAIFASDLERAFDTAQALARRLALPITTDVGLRERSFGVFQGYTYADIDRRWPVEAARWRHHDPDFAPEGGETLREFSARAVAACGRIAAGQAGRSIAIVTHGGVLTALPRRHGRHRRAARGPAMRRSTGCLHAARLRSVGWPTPPTSARDDARHGSEGTWRCRSGRRGDERAWPQPRSPRSRPGRRDRHAGW